MADVARLIAAGPAADWLESRRDELNQRFRRARRRFPAIDAERVLDTLADVLPPLAGPEPEAGDLLSAVVDLVLLHAGRETLESAPGIRSLLVEGFPELRSLLLQRPSLLPGALSNAVENQGRRGEDFVLGLVAVADGLTRPRELHAAGAVMAWRFGEPRLRRAALESAAALPPAVLLSTLDLGHWPVEAAPLAIASLHGDAWQHPAERVTTTTLKGLPGMSRQAVDRLAARLMEPPPSAPLEAWAQVGTIGDFAGFGGQFLATPTVLAAGSRHQLFLRSGTRCFCVDADLFGWACTPVADLAAPVLAPAKPSPLRRIKQFLGVGAKLRLERDGTLRRGEDSRLLPALSGTTSYAVLGDALAAANAKRSYRIRIVAAKGGVI